MCKLVVINAEMVSNACDINVSNASISKPYMEGFSVAAR